MGAHVISMNELRARMEASIGDPSAATKETVDAAIRAHVAYLFENYSELDPEAKAYADTALKEMTEQAAAKVGAMPNSPEKRMLVRLLARLNGRHFNVRGILAGLDREGPELEPYMKAAEYAAMEILREAADVMFDATTGGPRGEQKFTIAALMGWVIEDLVVALKLARHGLSNQAIAILRTTDEKLDLVDLFTKEPQHLDVWLHASHKERWNKLGPKHVRKLLGRGVSNSAYDYFCAAGGHPTLLGIKNRSVLRRPEGAEEPEFMLWVGGERLPWALHPLYLGIIGHSALALASAISWSQLYAKNEENAARLERAERLFDEWREQYGIPMLREMSGKPNMLADEMGEIRRKLRKAKGESPDAT